MDSLVLELPSPIIPGMISVMNNFKNPLVTVGAVMIVILAFAFYWFQWRPVQIKKDCAQKSLVLNDPVAIYGTPFHPGPKYISNPVFYDSCLKENGLQ